MCISPRLSLQKLGSVSAFMQSTQSLLGGFARLPVRPGIVLSPRLNPPATLTGLMMR